MYLVKAGGGYMLEFWPRSTSRPKTGVFCVLITEARETSALEMPDKENTFVIKVNIVNAAALENLLFLRIMISFLDPHFLLSYYKQLNDFKILSFCQIYQHCQISEHYLHLLLFCFLR